MKTFDDKYWNLAQTTAWVVFRNFSEVERFGGPSPEGWLAYMMYDSMWTCAKVEDSSDLRDALVSGRLRATGHDDLPGAKITAIPAIEWESLILDPPVAYRRLSNNTKDIPWNHIRVASADVKKIWRGTTEISARTRHDWAAIKSIFEEIQLHNPKFSMNELIEETKQAFQDRFKKEPPSRTSFQRHISNWT